MEFARDEIDLLKTTKAHLSALYGASAPWADEHSLRVASASLRFLFVDGNLLRAWRASRIGGPIEVQAYCFSSPPDSDAVGFCGGGDILPGIPISMSWGQVKLSLRKLNLQDFLRKPCIAAKGLCVSRHELIQYIANTKGGSHYDPSGRSPKSQRAKYVLLRDIEENGLAGLGINLNDRDLIHHEISSMIKSVLESPQIQRLEALPLPNLGPRSPGQ